MCKLALVVVIVAYVVLGLVEWVMGRCPECGKIGLVRSLRFVSPNRIGEYWRCDRCGWCEADDVLHPAASGWCN